MGSFDPIWEQIHREQEWGKYPSEEVIRFVARNFYGANRATTRILDVGCGTGAVTWFLAREGFRVYAFDGSETAVRKAKQRLQEEGLQATLSVGDAACLSYANDYFDGLIDSAMIYSNTVVNIKTILKECHRVLKKGGKAFFTGLFKVGMTGYGSGEKIEDNTFRGITEGALAHRGTAHFFSEPEIISLWTEAGFSNLKIDTLERTDRGGVCKVSYYMLEADK
ncbi:MAG: class I SAM-dependent methyltransferase [Syntrophomonadaceae bacterium]|nr:class I SAM-dependent methyltransferase [Syntrophomonadaceae bacterium]